MIYSLAYPFIYVIASHGTSQTHGVLSYPKLAPETGIDFRQQTRVILNVIIDGRTLV